MSPIIRTALEGEETSKTEAMMQTLRQSLHLERQPRSVSVASSCNTLRSPAVIELWW